MSELLKFKNYWTSIRGRLFLAFSVLSAFTIFASLIGWLSHNSLSDELNAVAKGNLQALKLMADIRERATVITITAPTLLAAQTPVQQHDISQTLNENLNSIIKSIPKIENLLPNEPDQPTLFNQFSLLKNIFNKLNQNVNKNIIARNKIRKSNERLRWASAVFLSDIDYLNDNIRTKLYSHLNHNAQETKFIINNELQALYRLNADVNLLINMLDRAQYLTDLNSQIATAIHSEDIILRIKANLTILNKRVHLTTVQKTVAHIIELATAENNIFAIRKEERLIYQDGQTLLQQTQKELNKLDSLLDLFSTKAEKVSEQALLNAQQTINRGRVLMVFSVAASLLFSIIIIWLYVGKNMVARITALNIAMKAIANGNLEHNISLRGRDEIGAMARSLRSFRDQLNTLQEELVQTGKLAAVGQLSAGIAHEINQPLSAIRLYTRNGIKLIQKEQYIEVEDNLHYISSLTKRAISIINKLNAMARNEKTTLVRYDLALCVNNALKVLIDEKANNLDAINVDIKGDKFYSLIDSIQLEQVIINLINNALDAVSSINTKNILIRCEYASDDILLKITDNGSGIDTELQKKIFDPFFTTKPRGLNLGLGLSISYNILKSFNGNLSVSSIPGEGTCFSIRLPNATH